MADSLTAGSSHPLGCPFCGVRELRTSGVGPLGYGSARCESCGGVLGGVFLDTLRRIAGLPEAIGRHPCECGHPEMRRLPDGVYWCPACTSEVLPVWYPYKKP